MDAYALQDSLDSSKRQLSPRSLHLTTYYTLLEQIGKGSYGVVWLARKRVVSGQHEAPVYAVKQVRKRHAGPKRMLEIMGEVETMSLLSHPNIVKLEETFQDEDNLWIVMEYMAGGELQHRFAAQSLPPPPEALTRRIITQLVLAVEYIHDKGIVHRDLKPANCLLTKDKQTVKISDFGFAVLAGVEQCLTAYCGTVAFMAPEILLERNYGKPVDMWSIGIMTYLLTVGELPFSGTTAASLTRAICSHRCNLDDARLRERAVVRDFVSRLLIHDPNRRMTARDALRHAWLMSTDHPSTDARLMLFVRQLPLLEQQQPQQHVGCSTTLPRSLTTSPSLLSATAATTTTMTMRGSTRATTTAATATAAAVLSPLSASLAAATRLTPMFVCAAADGGTVLPRRLRWVRSCVIAVMAAHRLRYFQRCRRLDKLGYGEFPLLRDFHYAVSNVYELRKGNALMCGRMFCTKPMAVLELLPMIESCAAVEHVDLSTNNMSSLSLVQSVLRTVSQHPSITSLDLSHNPLPSVAARGLMRLARNPTSRLLRVVMVDTGIGADVVAQMEQLLKEKMSAAHLAAGPLAGGDACSNSTTSDVASSHHASTSSTSSLSRYGAQRAHALLGVTADASGSRNRRAQHKQLFYTKLPPIPHAALLRKH